LSGGQQQRIVIAMALMAKPALLILDEPTTALDVTVEAGIVDLVKDLGQKYGTSMLFISHNLGLVMDVCDRLCVMYSGEAVETGNVDAGLRQDAPPLYPGAVPLDPAARGRQEFAAADPFPATSPCRMNARRAATSARAATISKPAAATPPMSRCPGAGRDRHASRCLRWTEIDWAAPPESPRQ
jgi:peptide/nickel transport system ATP-binding protein